MKINGTNETGRTLHKRWVNFVFRWFFSLSPFTLCFLCAFYFYSFLLFLLPTHYNSEFSIALEEALIHKWNYFSPQSPASVVCPNLPEWQWCAIALTGYRWAIIQAMVFYSLSLSLLASRYHPPVYCQNKACMKAPLAHFWRNRCVTKLLRRKDVTNSSRK